MNYESLSREDKNELFQILQAKILSLPVWRPRPENKPQTLAYNIDCDEIFYGGAAGGGKSDLLIGKALTHHNRSVIYRREFPQAANIIDRITELIRPRGGNVNSHKYEYKIDKHLIRVRSVEHDKDKEKHAGNPYELIAFDEITQFPESVYLYLSTWNRTTRQGHKCQIIAAGNPPTSSTGVWVKKRWAAWLDKYHPNPAKSGEVRWYVSIDGKDTEVEDGTPIEHKGEMLQPKSRTFIKSTADDNPDLGANYKATLQALPDHLRRAFLLGDFSIMDTDEEWQLIPGEWIDKAIQRGKEMEAGQITSLGVDIARGGQDETCIAELRGDLVSNIHSYPGITTPDGQSIISKIAPIVYDSGTTPFICIDVIGVGGSPFDIARGIWGNKVKGVNVGEGSKGRTANGNFKFSNYKAELFWHFRERLNPDSDNPIGLPDDRQMAADLKALKWKLVGDKIKIESKDELKKRIGRSPDRAEAVVYAFHSELMGSNDWASLIIGK